MTNCRVVPQYPAMRTRSTVWQQLGGTTSPKAKLEQEVEDREVELLSLPLHTFHQPPPSYRPNRPPLFPGRPAREESIAVILPSSSSPWQLPGASASPPQGRGRVLPQVDGDPASPLEITQLAEGGGRHALLLQLSEARGGPAGREELPVGALAGVRRGGAEVLSGPQQPALHTGLQVGTGTGHQGLAEHLGA